MLMIKDKIVFLVITWKFEILIYFGNRYLTYQFVYYVHF